MTNANTTSQKIFSGGERTLFYGLMSAGGLFLLLLALPFLAEIGSNVRVLAGGPVTVPVVLSEFRIQPASFAFKAGDRVKFEIENSGELAHEFRLTTRTSAGAHAAGGHEGHDDSAGGTDEQGDVWVVLNPGETGILEVAFDEHSSFDLAACMLPGHYEAGMTRPLTMTGVIAPAADDHAHAEAEEHATDEHAAMTDEEHAAMTDEAQATEEHAHVEGEEHATEEQAVMTDEEHAAMTDEAQATEEHAHVEGEEHATEEQAVMTDEEHATMTEADREILIYMNEFSFDPSEIEVARGETIRFTIVNVGNLRHEFRLTTEHAALEQASSADAGHHADDGGDLIVALDPGAAETLIVTFDEDVVFDTLACFLEDHYQSGLSAPLTITA